MTKIVIGTKIGGFHMTTEAFQLYGRLKGIKFYYYTNYMPEDGGFIGQYIKITLKEAKKNYSVYVMQKNFGEIVADLYSQDCYSFMFHYRDLERDDPYLIQVVELLGKKLGMEIIEVPDDVEWHISSSDSGEEWIAENHRVWDEYGERIQE